MLVALNMLALESTAQFITSIKIRTTFIKAEKVLVQIALRLCGFQLDLGD